MAISVQEVSIITPTGDVVQRFGLFSTRSGKYFPFHYDTLDTALARGDKIADTVCGRIWIEEINFCYPYPVVIG